jgi:hypothetical protein
VGSYFPTSKSSGQTLVEHYAGGSWSIVPSQNLGFGGSFLNGVAVVSATDVWAVGVSYPYSSPTGSGPGQALVERCTATGCTIVPSPDLGPGGGTLNGVAADPAGDVWAVGVSYAPYSTNPGQTLIERCTATSCTRVVSLNQGSGANVLYGVAENSAGHVWAVGKVYSTALTRTQTLVEYFDGSIWKVVPSSNQGSGDNVLYGVTAVSSSSDVWAVGTYAPTAGGIDQTIIERDQGSWSPVPSQNYGSGRNEFAGVAAATASDVWVVGWWDVTSTSPSKTNAAVWDGQTWTGVTLPNQGTGENVLYSVTAVSASDLWAVGTYSTPPTPGSTLGDTQSLMMHYSINP